MNAQLAVKTLRSASLSPTLIKWLVPFAAAHIRDESYPKLSSEDNRPQPARHYPRQAAPEELCASADRVPANGMILPSRRKHGEAQGCVAPPTGGQSGYFRSLELLREA